MPKFVAEVAFGFPFEPAICGDMVLPLTNSARLPFTLVGFGAGAC